MNLQVKYDIIDKKENNTISVTNKNKTYSSSSNNKRIKECKNMINDEKYIIFLKRIIACISHGDYYSVKELSQLELEKVKTRKKSKKIY